MVKIQIKIYGDDPENQKILRNDLISFLGEEGITLISHQISDKEDSDIIGELEYD